jgi:hypothetical protein
MFIKDAYRLGVLIIAKLSKERCISLVVGRRPFHITHKHDSSKWGAFQPEKTYSSKEGLSKI